jgi:hypothetical protein
VLSDLAGFGFVTRGKDYSLLDHPSVAARLHMPPDQVQQRPESQMVRRLYDCPQIPVGSLGAPCRVIVATHPAGKNKSPVGVARAGIVYELFFTTLPQQAFTACDVVEVYLHRGAFEPVLSDEDQKIDPGRWGSHSAWGQECWQLVSQWVWNLRLEPGHQLHPDSLRTTECAPALPPHNAQTPTCLPSPPTAPASESALPTTATSWKAGRFTGAGFPLQPDGTLRCPAGQSLRAQEHRREGDGSLRVVYAASIRSCRSCPLREQCQWNGSATQKPRHVSMLLHPLAVGSAPLLWHDWSRREHRRACMQFVRHQRTEVSLPPPAAVSPGTANVILSRAQRAHSRLSWHERQARQARVSTTGQGTIRLFGVPDSFATLIGLASA